VSGATKVTVLMSVYNGERYLREAVESILGQTFADFEFLIINDGSTDGTREILESYTDSRIRVVHQANIGIAAAREDPGVAAISTGARVLRTDREEVRTPRFSDSTLPALLLEKNPLVSASVLLRRSALLDVGGYGEQYPYAHDREMWLRLAWAGERFQEALSVRLGRARGDSGGLRPPGHAGHRPGVPPGSEEVLVDRPGGAEECAGDALVALPSGRLVRPRAGGRAGHAGPEQD